MRHLAPLALSALFAVATPAFAADPSWLQYTATGTELRAVLSDGGKACPAAAVDGHDAAMTLRAAATPDFPTVCALVVPAGTKSLSFEGRPITLPVADPQRILVLGDTGCRIKGTALQACNDPTAWPFAGLAAAAAAQKPDLVLHLGDYLYRESACPASFPGCAGSPWGDNWPAWNADFFSPAAPLLAAAPWIVIRGNHEDCYRAGPGFLRLLGPTAFDPAAICNPHLDPYLLNIGSESLAIIDSASAADTPLDEKAVPAYQSDFATLKSWGAGVAQGHELWFATHRPLWGAIRYLGLPAGGNATMIKAAGDLSAFQAVSLMLAGHIHAFEAINYVDRVPPQIIAGHGGDNLDSTPSDLRGTIFLGDSGVHVKTGFTIDRFGFLMFTQQPGGAGWSIALYDSAGQQFQQCTYESRAVFCMKPR